MSNAGGFKSLNRYYDMLAGNTVWNPWSPDGAYDSLATVTLSASTASVTFAGIPSTYKHLQVRVSYGLASANNPTWRVNGDTTGANYVGHHLWGDGATAFANAQTSGTVYWSYIPNASFPGAAIMDFLDYANTSKNKTMRTLTGSDGNGSGEVALWSGAYLQTAAISSITLAGGSNFTANSSFALYGIK